MNKQKVKTIMVYDIAAEKAGTLAVLSDFYADVEKRSDYDIKWLFIVSKPIFNENANVMVMRYPWVKRSWFHRLFFDIFCAPRIAHKYNVNLIFSMQDICVRVKNIPQILYVHKPLPFVDVKFSFLKESKYWVHQNVIGTLIFKSVKKADAVVVQSQWMKEAMIERIGIYVKNKIYIIHPVMPKGVIHEFKATNESYKTFFYPASASIYKDHNVIIEACKIISAADINNYKVVLTLSGTENKAINNLYETVKDKKLPVVFVGTKPREWVMEMYSQSVLLFPSYIETFGMPLLEAKLSGCPIIAANTKFAHEILETYAGVFYFDAKNAMDLAANMKNKIFATHLESFTSSKRIIDYDNSLICFIVNFTNKC